MKNRIFFKLELDIAELDESMPKQQKCSRKYEAELIVQNYRNNSIELKIFYNHKEYLGEKIMRIWHKSRNHLLSQFRISEIISPKTLIEIDISSYSIKGMQNSTNFNEFDLKYCVLNLSGVNKIYQNSGIDKNEFYLNQQAFDLVEMHYHYKSPMPWTNEEYNWSPKNEIREFLKFGMLSFKPEHSFHNSNENNSENVSIKKEPKLTIKYEKLSVSEIRNHIELLCTLYSFYALEKIDYSLSRIYNKNKLYIEIKDIPSFSIEKPFGLFEDEFNQDPLNLMINIDTSHLIKNLELFKKLIERFLYALKTVGESKFMILYNLLEQIRNQYILEGKIDSNRENNPPNLKKVTEEYNFKLSKTKTDKYIKDVLENIVEIVADEDKNLFRSEIKFKLTPLKVVSMKNQFSSLFDYINIEPNSCGLEFMELKKIRDSVFHGRPINIATLNEINNYDCLPKFVGTVILKYAGIKDLSMINHIKHHR